MLKKLTMIGCCTLGLLATTACSSTTAVTENSSSESEVGSLTFGDSEEHFYDESSFGFKPETLFAAMHQIAPSLKLDQVKATYTEDGFYLWEDQELNIAMMYLILDEKEYGPFKNKDAEGTMDKLSIYFDHSDAQSRNYILKFMDAVNQIAFENQLKEEILETSEGFYDYDLTFEILNEEDTQYFFEEAPTYLKSTGLLNAKEIAVLMFG